MSGGAALAPKAAPYDWSNVNPATVNHRARPLEWIKGNESKNAA
jgi:hypothetical protein